MGVNKMLTKKTFDRSSGDSADELEKLAAELDALAEALFEHIPPDRQPLIVIQANQMAQRHFETHLAATKHRGSPDYQTKSTAIKPMIRLLARCRRWYTCLSAASPHQLEATLRWYAEQGEVEDLVRVVQCETDARYAGETAVQQLAKKAKERIYQRAQEPARRQQTPDLYRLPRIEVEIPSAAYFVFDPLLQGLRSSRDALPEMITCCEKLLEHLVQRAEEYAGDDWDELRLAVKTWLTRARRTARRQELRAPSSPENYAAALRWMAEQGDIDDLELIRRLKGHPAYDYPVIRGLFETSDERIHGRVYHPKVVLAREETAYQQYRQEWDDTYKGEFIAIHRGEVVDHDPDKYRLIQRLDQKQREYGRFRTYIVQVGGVIYAARGPRIGRSATRTRG